MVLLNILTAQTLSKNMVSSLKTRFNKKREAVVVFMFNRPRPDVRTVVYIRAIGLSDASCFPIGRHCKFVRDFPVSGEVAMSNRRFDAVALQNSRA